METSDLKTAAALGQKTLDNINRVVIGKSDVALKTCLAIFAGGHVLLEDVPGVGKTLLAKALARSVAGELKRVQFTADLLPSDITGATVYRQKQERFVFQEGPIFCDALLADEINRASPRAQSSLLEAMEEGQVTVDGVTYPLRDPFFVIATQNPIELEGTYPLPFSQIDRFMVRRRIGYLDAEEEKRLLKERRLETPLDNLRPVISLKELTFIRDAVKHVRVDDTLYDYIIAIIRATRESDTFEYGASPRGALDLARYSQAMALLDGREYVLPDDVKRAAPATLGHRVIVRRGARLATAAGDRFIEELLSAVPVLL